MTALDPKATSAANFAVTHNARIFMQFFKTVAATERYAEAKGGVGKTVPISAFSGNKDALNTVLGNTIFCRLLYCRHTTGRLAGIARMGRMGNGTRTQTGLRSGIGAHRREGLCARLAPMRGG